MSVSSDDLSDDFTTLNAKAVLHDETAIDTLRAKGALGFLKKSQPVDGNIYKYFVFRRFMETKHVGDDSMFSPPEQFFDRACMLVGLVCIMCIQIIAPIALVTTNIFPLIESLRNPFGADAPCKDYMPSQWMVVILVVCFLFCFVLNAYNGLVSDMQQMGTVVHICTLMERGGYKTNKCMLVVDALVNTYAAVFLSISMFTVLYGEQTAQAVVMDSLGMAFVMSIDDLASDLGFLSDVWEKDRLGQFYQGLKDLEAMDAEECGSDSDLDAEVQKTFLKCTFCIYTVGRIILMMLIPLALISPFVIHSSAMFDAGLQDLMHGKLLDEIAHKTAVVKFEA
jgi:succinate dehydrogenase/fumarate reductase cytochrome b subunit